METAFFWIAWGIISFWALKSFYYSFSKEKLELLRKASLGINFAVLVLTFFPWLPLNLGGKSGLTLAFEGNFLALLFVILLVGSSALFLLKDRVLLKFAAVANIVNTFLLFILMYQVRPGTFTPTLYDIAPIVSVLFLLVNDIAVLLLWQQLQLRDKRTKKKSPQMNRVIILAGITILIVIGLLVFRSQKNGEQEGVSLVSQLSEVAEFKKDVEKNGRSKFAVEVASEPKTDTDLGQYYLIQVFEIFPDHTATFGWYRYDPKTRKLFRSNVALDTWEEVSY